ncbi:glutamate-5-semialdehyde dehydrogenase [Sphingobacterium alkalisoli]|uniref:Gamma-glutamyl phosphate reductase n=1 Tax=Sphingobacterium alkalisoli TaxID=1874115 RepID=A0A4U0GXE6_9SPHI|nr:glutamate-5-semialdehyde dehydrogenase [Sphingobacterium alkalisoli]TJY62492.1 glutamate-5-semialdehyde dehydrogenase [Sphingobacterium alkalisoli]GGH29145.1 gamma-glutamyl phosphate reductase [Sphingobacterium alkalisoli]
METIEQLLKDASQAKQVIQPLSLETKRQVLARLSSLLITNSNDIIAMNQKDLDRMDITDPKYDRLVLNKERIEGLAQSVIDVSQLEDPTGKVLLTKQLANGLYIEKKSVALGVVGVIYESRPNVTIDVAALCIQSGNVCLLRGGSDAWFTNSILVDLIHIVLREFDLDEHIVQLLPTDRKFVSELLTATRYVDIIIPRGSQSLIDLVRKNAKVPVIETGAGVCHTYVEETANLEDAAQIVANAKISRPSVCNSLDTILVDRKVSENFLHRVAPLLQEASVEIFADEDAFATLASLNYPHLQQATESDYGREFLDFKCSVKVIDNFQEALDHIAMYSSKHSECIVSSNPDHISAFMNVVDAAAVYSNASTRFTDGGEFGLGAEIGISTQKLHARGPFALEKLVTEKWFVTGNGQVR